MADKHSTPQDEEIALEAESKNGKKRKKREQRMHERLAIARVAQAHALDRLQRAQARLEKRTARLQRTEERLAHIRQQLAALQGVSPLPSTEAPESAQQATSLPLISEQGQEAELEAQEARTAAEAAEKEARLAVQRVANQPQEASVQAPMPEPQTAEAPFSPEGEQSTPDGEIQEREPAMTPVMAADSENPVAGGGTAMETEPREGAQAGAADEEEGMEDVTDSITIAEVAAAAAAQATAMAEASSATTREARRNTQQAEENLRQVREAIQRGELSGEEAESSLRSAEDAYTQALAVQADAEAAEESAMQAARTAEVEATVAEVRLPIDIHSAEQPYGEQA